MHKAPSGNVYIGITSKSLQQRWGKDGKRYANNPHFVSAIKKYGWDNIEHLLLFDNLTEEEAKMIEVDLIHYYKKIGRSYNITDGGEGWRVKGRRYSDERKKHLSETTKKAWTDPSYREDNTKHLLEVGYNTRFKKGQNLREKACSQYDLDGNFIKTYPSVKAAREALGVGRAIEDCCRGKNKTAYGYKWKYKNEC